MQIKIYVKNKDMKKVNEHLKKFLAKHLEEKNRIELKKISNIDKLNHALIDENYKRIVIFYIDNNLLNGALIHIAELLTNGVEIRIIFKYGHHGNIICVNHKEIMDFIKEDEELSNEAVNRFYQ